ncbi:MAG: P-loop NTPase fold protein [Anaerolineae bacterium]|nr:P-loop NTPase fold protein [Anaerolineae bacterium]
MNLDTMQQLRRQALPAIAASAGITLSAEQSRALDAVLAALGQPGSRRAIGLFGPRGSGKTTLLKALSRDDAQAQRILPHRRIVCALINAANLPSDLAPWQRLVFGALDKLAQQPGAPAAVHTLRNQLEEVVRLELDDDASATLAVAAFAHRMRASFAGLIHSAITLSDATFVVAIDHLDRAKPEDAAQLLEAAKYFLSAQNCATLICADEAELIRKLGDANVLRAWLTDRVELRPSKRPASPANAPTRLPQAPPPTAPSDIPRPCAQLFAEMLGSDRYAIERAEEYWRAAMRGLAKRMADGQRADVSDVMLAKLCVLRVLSPALFDAVRLDAPALAALERRARAQPFADESHGDWAAALAHNPRLNRLFASAPSFIGVETRHLATALRLVYAGDKSSAQQTQPPAAASATGEARPAAPASAAAAALAAARAIARGLHRSHQRSSAAATSPAPFWALISVAAGVFVVDRLVKAAVQFGEGSRGGAAALGGLIRLQPPTEVGLLDTGLGIAVTLAGLALCMLMMAFVGHRADGLRPKAYGLIVGGLAAHLFDRLTWGAAMNYLHIPNLPTFNLAHLAALAGAILLAFAILTDARSRHKRSAP